MTQTPAASFILLSYCQEDSISASVQSLLDQDCEPIEIIISDDASTDRTFEKIRQLADGYAGPHRVVARRNEANMGVNRHIELAISLASCDLMIWTAGDDRNAPDRAQRIIDSHRQSGAKLIYSDAETIGPDGEPGEDAYRRALFYRDFGAEDAATAFSLYLGATAAWHKDLYRKYGGFPKDRAYEDLILGFRALLENRLHYIPEKLVTYQENVGISTRLTKKISTLSNQERRTRMLKGQLAVLEQRLADARTFGLEDNAPLVRKMTQAAGKIRARLESYDGIGAVLGSKDYGWSAKLQGIASEGMRRLRNR
ncbi:glycosyltransferase family 2 protein [Leisingera thetidis]|uniref:glycosyltransferase family 2 protein n=1 Tax=Leisingera thetidis TaxID=2930199 RepID=UPI0021F7AAE0|nr:glycosyltransferase [Leisingera thetidis]